MVTVGSCVNGSIIFVSFVVGFAALASVFFLTAAACLEADNLLFVASFIFFSLARGFFTAVGAAGFVFDIGALAAALLAVPCLAAVVVFVVTDAFAVVVLAVAVVVVFAAGFAVVVDVAFGFAVTAAGVGGLLASDFDPAPAEPGFVAENLLAVAGFGGAEVLAAVTVAFTVVVLVACFLIVAGSGFLVAVIGAGLLELVCEAGFADLAAAAPTRGLAVAAGAGLALVDVRTFGGVLAVADIEEVLVVGVDGLAEGGLVVGATLLIGVEFLLEAKDGLAAVPAGLVVFVKAVGFLVAVDVGAPDLGEDFAVTEEGFVGVLDVSIFLTAVTPVVAEVFF